MPAPRAKLHKVGLSPRQSRALALTAPTRTELMRVGGFTKRQADELVMGRFEATTNAGGYTVATLIKIAGFTKAQATLIFQAT